MDIQNIVLSLKIVQHISVHGDQSLHTEEQNASDLSKFHEVSRSGLWELHPWICVAWCIDDLYIVFIGHVSNRLWLKDISGCVAITSWGKFLPVKPEP